MHIQGQKALRLGKPVFSTARIKCQLLDLARDVGVLDEEMQATLRACPDLKQIKYSIRVQNIPLQLDDEVRHDPSKVHCANTIPWFGLNSDELV